MKRITFKSLSLLPLFLLMSSCEEDSLSPINSYQKLEGNTGIIGAAGGSLTITDTQSPIHGAAIFIPEGAVDEVLEFSISEVLDDTVQGIENAIIIDFEPSGETFNKKVELVLPYKGQHEKAKLFYRDKEAEEMTQVQIKHHDRDKKQVRALVSHFSRYVVTDREYAWFDVDMYSTETGIKSKICFSGKAWGLEGLAGIPIKKWYKFTSDFTITNVSQMIENGIPMYGYMPLLLHCTIEASLVENNLVYTKLLDKCSIALQRRGDDLATSYIRIFEPEGRGALIDTEPLDKDKREAYFSGKNLVFAFNTIPQEGKKYHLELSYCFSDNINANRITGSRYTHMYKINTFDENDPWTIERMSEEDPDTNGNLVDDEAEGLIKEMEVISKEPYNITNTTVTAGGTIKKPDDTRLVEWGICYDKDFYRPTINQNKVICEDGEMDFTLSVTGLEKYEKYYIRAYAITSDHEVRYGESFAFRTTNVTINKPTVISNTAEYNGFSVVNLSGEVLADGGAEVTDRGFFMGKSPGPAISGTQISSGTGTGSFSASLENLDRNVTYYFVAYAENSKGISYSEERSIRIMWFVPETGFVEDIEGNSYATVKIGSQWWMAENLRTTLYNDGTTIPEVQNASIWTELNTPAYSWYANDDTNGREFGALYNWYTCHHSVNDEKNVCPAGWAVPSLDQWSAMREYLIDNGFNYDGSFEYQLLAKALSLGSGWKANEVPGSPGNSDYPGVVNASGFSSIPSGHRRFNDGVFTGNGEVSAYWTSTEVNTNGAIHVAIHNSLPWTESGAMDKKNGFSIRCIKE